MLGQTQRQTEGVRIYVRFGDGVRKSEVLGGKSVRQTSGCGRKMDEINSRASVR